MEDLEDFHSFRSDPEICKFQSFLSFTLEDSKKFLVEQRELEFGKPGEWVQTGIVLKETQKLIGDFALQPELEQPKTIEIGATLNTPYQGKGFAKEALSRVIEYLFSENETHRIIGVLDTENHASRKLCESLNFRREAEHKKSYWDEKMNEWRDEYVYAMLKEEWELSK